MGPNSLDALCKRYGIDNSHRTLHGALLDAELLAEVYLELNGGRQAALGLVSVETKISEAGIQVSETVIIGERPAPLPLRFSEAERIAHEALVRKLGDQAIWRRISGYSG